MRDVLVGLVLIVGAAAFGYYGTGPSHKPVQIPAAAPGQSETAPRPVQENVIAYHTGDETMNAAKHTGNSTLPRFHELMAAGTAGTYTVKFPLTQNGQTEHIWMQLTGYRDGTFHGLLANTPVNGDDYKMGDAVEVAEADVEDWMINTGTEIYGGYTARAALKDMPKEDAEKYRKMFRD